MILWIDGTCGIGQSSVAKRIYELLLSDKVLLIESDECYKQFANQRPILAMFCGGTPQNNKAFLAELKKIIINGQETSELLIIAMTTTMVECKEILIDYFDKDDDFVHIILDADKDEIIERIQADDKERQKKENIADIDRSINFLNEYADAIHVNTNGKSIDEVSKEIITRFIKRKLIEKTL